MAIDDASGIDLVEGFESSTASGSTSWVPGLRYIIGWVFFFHQLVLKKDNLA